jgi:hypothetical protein
VGAVAVVRNQREVEDPGCDPPREASNAVIQGRAVIASVFVVEEFHLITVDNHVSLVWDHYAAGGMADGVGRTVAVGRGYGSARSIAPVATNDARPNTTTSAPSDSSVVDRLIPDIVAKPHAAPPDRPGRSARRIDVQVR